MGNEQGRFRAMTYTESIRIALDEREIAEKLRFDSLKSRKGDLAGLVTMAQGHIEPRALFEVGDVGALGENTVDIAGITFISPILRQNLENVSKVFPYIITVGPRLERAAAEEGDLLRQYYLEEIANFALEQAADWLAGHLKERFGIGGLSSLSPGSLGSWPITEQAKLFSIFGDTEKLIGVRLTDSMLMIPRKSVSGILFPAEEGFVACQLCARERCSGRKAPYQSGPQ
jgi:hypothetical protein